MQSCRNCYKRNLWRKTGETTVINGYTVRIWQCRCGEKQADEPPQGLKTKARILYFDIEYAMGTAYYYNRKVSGGYISTSMLLDQPFVICWAAAWDKDTTLHPKIESMSVTSKEAVVKSDRRIMKGLWELLDSADYVVGHNVDGFDVKKVNNRFVQLGMDLPYLYKTVDTLKLSRKYFPFESNGLDYIAQKIGGKAKRDIDFDDWRRIVETGDEKTLIKAERYCKGDVREGLNVWRYFRRKIESSGKVLIK